MTWCVTLFVVLDADTSAEYAKMKEQQLERRQKKVSARQRQVHKVTSNPVCLHRFYPVVDDQPSLLSCCAQTMTSVVLSSDVDLCRAVLRH